MEKKLSYKYFDNYRSSLDIDIQFAFEQVEAKDWTVDNFKTHTAVSVMSSSRIEGEMLEIDSYVKHKLNNIEYLPNLTEKPNDLYLAYEFARDNSLTLKNFLHTHVIATRHILPVSQSGVIRTGNMVIMNHQTNSIQYEAASSAIVKKEFESFWDELSVLINQPLSIEEVFYYAALIHLVFVKIHPFNDGNGRTARLLEKWFIAAHLGQKAWYIGSEYYYYNNLKSYYNNLSIVGLFYSELDYQKAMSFLNMLPQSLRMEK